MLALDSSHSEAVAVGKDIEAKLKPAAEEKKKSGKSADGKAGGRGKKKDKPSSKLEEGLSEPPSDSTPAKKPKPKPQPSRKERETRTKVAKAVGMKPQTYSKAEKVVDAAAKEPDQQRPRGAGRRCTCLRFVPFFCPDACGNDLGDVGVVAPKLSPKLEESFSDQQRPRGRGSRCTSAAAQACVPQ